MNPETVKKPRAKRPAKPVNGKETRSKDRPGVRHVTVTRDHDGQRIDNFLARELKGVPKTAIYRIIRTGQVRISGKRCKPNHKVGVGDDVRIPPAHTREQGDFQVSDAVIRQVRNAIIHEDKDFIVIDKPSGMAVHSGSNLPWGLIDAVRQARPGEFVELAHRIDRETSGCVVLARSGEALRHVSDQFRDGKVIKRYLCLLDGHLKEAKVVVDEPVLKLRQTGSHTVETDDEGKEALTHFHLLQAYADCSYAEAEIFTGRTHQIRVHAAHLGLPLAGDDRYSSEASQRKWKKRGLRRLFLHAHSIRFESPGGDEISCNALLPDALRKVLDQVAA